jgi:hypothetical protein
MVAQEIQKVGAVVVAIALIGLILYSILNVPYLTLPDGVDESGLWVVVLFLIILAGAYLGGNPFDQW